MISKISIQNTRSLKEFDFEFGEGITVVHGPNGCGKTTLLESIHLLCQGFSFRTHDLKEMITWKSDQAILRGVFENESITRAIGIGRKQNTAKENGENVKSISAFFGTMPAVTMQPVDIELLRGAPEIRRRFLDEILCYRSKTNANILKRYRRVLQQRNQWLRQYKKDYFSGHAPNAIGGEELFEILTEQLIDLGAELWKSRIELTKEISPIITSYYQQLSGGIDEICCNYKSSILKELENLDAMDSADFLEDFNTEEISMAAEKQAPYLENSVAELKEAFRKKLSSLKFAERAQGITLSGPHKDDLSLFIGEQEMRSAGSQGQCRSAAIAMGFAAVDVASRYLSKPILLLDDIFAELDIRRRDAVSNLIREKSCQVIIATPQKDELPFKADGEIHLNFD